MNSRTCAAQPWILLVVAGAIGIYVHKIVEPIEITEVIGNESACLSQNAEFKRMGSYVRI